MPTKILTLDNLYQFFVEQNKAFNFSSKESGKPIVVSILGNFEAEEDDMPGMLKVKLKVCHIDTNRNGSHISQENMEKAMPTLKYRPILAYIHQLQDGTYDFYAHNMEIVKDENGEEQINYIEKQVGCFTADEPCLEYDKEMDKTYVVAYGVIPEEYTQAADIIRRKQGTKVSCELVINELSYNAAEKYLDLIDFYFGGTTLLGCDDEGNEIGEGMLGSRLDIADFCHKEPIYDCKDKLVEVLDKLNITLSAFSHNVKKEGGGTEMDKFHELLDQYGFTEDELDFEHEGMTDEELETAFEEYAKKKKKCAEEDENDDDDEDGDIDVVEQEACGKKKKKKCAEEDEDSNDDDDDGNVSTEQEACGTKKKKKKCSIDENGNMSLSFEISHEDVRCALYQLISVYDEEDNDWYIIDNVYDDYFIFENWDGNKIYKQSYSVDGDNVALIGERTQMFKMILTESEKLTIDQMRENYAALEAKYNDLKAFKDQYEMSQIKAKKDEILNKEEYSILAEDEAFKNLVASAEKFSVEEIESKVKAIFADHIIATGEFSFKNNEKKPAAMHFNVNTVDEENKKPYGNLFP